jgi:hypothetical protein
MISDLYNICLGLINIHVILSNYRRVSYHIKEYIGTKYKITYTYYKKKKSAVANELGYDIHKEKRYRASAEAVGKVNISSSNTDVP